MNNNDPGHINFSSLLAGGVAGLVVDIVLFPIDTIKTRLQSEKGFWRSGGLRNIYSGLGPAAAGSVPTAALFFCTYESVKSVLLANNNNRKYDPLIHMTSASVAEVMACLIRVPVEIVKQRRQTLPISGSAATTLRPSSLTILYQAYQNEGFFRGFYRGFGSTILREIPFSFIQFPIWEYLKLHWTATTNLPLTSVAVAICGAIAGGISAAITTPLDVAKTRIMLAPPTSDVRKHSVPFVLRRIYAKKGIRGLFAGFIPRVLWITIGGAIFFGTYDFATKTYQSYVNNSIEN